MSESTIILAFADLALKLMAEQRIKDPTNKELEEKHKELEENIDRFKENSG